MKFVKSLFLTGLMALLFCSAAYAQDYIFRYRDGLVMPMSLEMEQNHLSGAIYLSDDEEELRRLYEAGVIEYYGPDATVELMDVADDLGYERQRGYEYRLTNAIGVVNNGIYNGSGVKVGIIDTGIVNGHPDINYSKIVGRRDVTAKENDPKANVNDVTDYQGHGTMVAGMISAVTNNACGLSSLASGADLMVIKAFPGNSNTTAVSNLILGLDYAIRQGCDVINMSVGAKEDANNAAAIKSMKEIIDNAANRGIIVVAAAGNHDSTTNNKNDLNKDSPFMYPGAFNNVISVASVDSNGSYSSFSYHNSFVDVAACGGSVHVLDFKNLAPSGYKTDSGTSFSSPYMASVAALVKQIEPEADVNRFRSLLQATSQDMGAPGWDTFYGFGIVNVGKIMDTLLGRKITVSGISFDSESFTASATITNSGFDSYTVTDIWASSSDGFPQYNQKTAAVELAPRSVNTSQYTSLDTVTHMVWFKDSLEPLCPADRYEPDVQ